MEKEQNNDIGRIIFVLAAFGFIMPLTCLLFAFIFSSDFIPLNIKDYSNQIITVFAIYSIFHISYPFLLDKFNTKLKESSTRVHLKWLTFGLYFSYLGVVISALNTDMNYAYAGVSASLAISFYVITYIKVSVKIDKKDIQLKVWTLIGTMNVIIGSIMICIPLFRADTIEIEEPFKSFFWGMIKHMGIFTLGFGLGILYVLFVLLRKRGGLKFFDE